MYSQTFNAQSEIGLIPNGIHRLGYCPYGAVAHALCIWVGIKKHEHVAASLYLKA